MRKSATLKRGSVNPRHVIVARAWPTPWHRDFRFSPTRGLLLLVNPFPVLYAFRSDSNLHTYSKSTVAISETFGLTKKKKKSLECPTYLIGSHDHCLSANYDPAPNALQVGWSDRNNNNYVSNIIQYLYMILPLLIFIVKKKVSTDLYYHTTISRSCWAPLVV
jgi:hypothetical protein